MFADCSIISAAAFFRHFFSVLFLTCLLVNTSHDLFYGHHFFHLLQMESITAFTFSKSRGVDGFAKFVPRKASTSPIWSIMLTQDTYLWTISVPSASMSTKQMLQGGCTFLRSIRYPVRVVFKVTRVIRGKMPGFLSKSLNHQ